MVLFSLGVECICPVCTKKDMSKFKDYHCLLKHIQVSQIYTSNDTKTEEKCFK